MTGPVSACYSILELPVAEGQVEALVRRFAELRILELAARGGGLRGARLLRPVEPGGPLVVVAGWDTAEAYRGWLADPERERVNAELAPLLAGEPRAALYEGAGSWPRVRDNGRRPT